MKLRELIISVKEKTLSKEDLEKYSDALAELYAEMRLEFSDLEKAEALYIYDSTANTGVAKRNNWRATKEGQRMIDLKNYMDACSKMISSVKSRVYRLIY